MSTSIQRVTTFTGDPAWSVTGGYDTLKALLADLRLGRSHPDPANAARYSESAMFGQAAPSSPTEQEDHAWMRRLLNRSFSVRRIAILRPKMQELVAVLLDELAGQTPPVDFHEAISFPLPALAICELFGVPFADRENFRRWSDEAGDPTDQARSQAGYDALSQYTRQLIAHKLQHPAEDTFSDLAAAHLENPEYFTPDKVVKLGAGLLFAGHETTTAAIDKGVVLLLSHPDQRAALSQDPALVTTAVEEILRFPDPTEEITGSVGVPRWTNAELTVDGVTIPARELVLLRVMDANCDKNVFSAPEVFDVNRTDNPHLKFGYGRYFCLGAPLLRMELQVLFGTLFHRFPTLRLAVPVEDLRTRSNVITGGLHELPVTW